MNKINKSLGPVERTIASYHILSGSHVSRFSVESKNIFSRKQKQHELENHTRVFFAACFVIIDSIS